MDNNRISKLESEIIQRKTRKNQPVVRQCAKSQMGRSLDSVKLASRRWLESEWARSCTLHRVSYPCVLKEHFWAIEPTYFGWFWLTNSENYQIIKLLNKSTSFLHRLRNSENSTGTPILCAAQRKTRQDSPDCRPCEFAFGTSADATCFSQLLLAAASGSCFWLLPPKYQPKLGKSV